MPRPQIRTIVLRLLVVWVTSAAALLLMSWLLGGFHVDSFWSALGAAALIGLVNALVWPTLIGVALPFTVLTLGLGVLVLNGLVVWLVAEVAAGVTIDNVWTGIVVAIGLTVVGTLGTSLLAIDDDNFYDRNVIRRQARKHGAVETDVPALYFLEIDGLAHAVLMRAIRDGNAPTMARWINDGSHHLIRWECDWSSQTGAAQTGHPARHERGHPGVSLVGQGGRPRGLVVAAAGCRGDRGADLERQGAAVRGRREPREHVLGRRAVQPADDEHRAPARPPGPDRQRLLRVLREPVQPHAHDRSRDRRHLERALAGGAAEAARHPAPRAPRPQVLVRARLDDRRPARPAGRLGRRGHLRRAPRPLHDVHRLRRGRPPLGDRAPGDAEDPPQARPAVRAARARRGRCAAARCASPCSPTTARRRERPSATVTASRSPTSSPRRPRPASRTRARATKA